MTNSLFTKQSDNLLFHTFDDTLKPQIEELLSLGKAAGADLVEIFLEKTDNISLLAEQDNISNVSPSFGVGAGISCEQLYPKETSIPGGPLEYFVSAAISEENKFDCFWIPGNDGEEINIGFTAETRADLDFYNPSETLTDDPDKFGHNYAVSSGDSKVIEWSIPMPSSYYETLSGGTGDYYFKVHQYGGFVENSRYSLEIIRAETPLLRDDMVTTMPEPI